ncbi:sterile alpha motif domain-containing protein 3-like [Pocillopora verrucosa]|uniref:sterile alpha motif domain-containing protein 3-like n=1 Tax=Pocillopora verrucosa TaxID=203993 RepID=UPI0033401DB3
MASFPKSVDEVKQWMIQNGFSSHASTFEENEIDGEAMQCLTENALVQLIPVVGPRMKFIKQLESLKKTSRPESIDVVEEGTPIANEEMEVQDRIPADTEVKARKRLEFDNKVSSPCPDDNIVLNAKMLWPRVLTLPTSFRLDVTRTLASKEKQNINKKFRREFIGSIYDHFARYTLYPTKHQLTSICELIVQKYPFLKDTSIGTGYDSWYASLYEKFRNERTSIKDDPEVILRKRKPKESSKECVKAKLRRGAINWEPPFPEGEDEVSLQRHKDFMKSEFEKRSPDWAKISKRMALTFPSRRRLMNDNMSIKEIKEHYPTLFKFEQILAEFERILGLNSSVVDSFRSNFQQVTDPIVKLGKTKNKSKSKEEIQTFLHLLEDDDNDMNEDESEPTIEEQAEVAMAVLPYLLLPKSGLISTDDFVHFVFEDEDIDEIVKISNKPFPRIVFKGQLSSPDAIYIIADQQVLCSSTNTTLLEATVCLMACYYVFLYDYPSGLNNFYLYLQKCILQLQDGKKLPSTVINFVNDIDAMSKI